MAKKPKKAKTPTQIKRQYKAWSHVCFASEFLSVFAPYFAIGIINYDKYFIQYDGTKVSIGFALAMVVMGIATYLTSKKNFTNSFVTLLVGWAMVTGITFLIKELLNDLCYILLFGWFGIAGAYGLDIGKKKLNDKAEKIQKGIDSAEEQIVREAYLDEQTKKNDKRTVKIKVKKED